MAECWTAPRANLHPLTPIAGMGRANLNSWTLAPERQSRIGTLQRRI